jgi:hypothetical protein
MSKKLVLNTMPGSVTYAMQSGDRHTAALKNDITSPGGATAAALYAADRGGFRTAISDAVWAAYRRSLELGNMGSGVGPGTTSTGAGPKEQAAVEFTAGFPFAPRFANPVLRGQCSPAVVGW